MFDAAVGLSAEFRLAAACCVPAGDSAMSDRVRALAAGDMDWPLFDAIARRQRIEGLAHAALRRTGVVPPAPVATSLAERAEALARANLFLAAEAVRVHRRLDEAGIPHLFVKGVTLARLAYGTIGLKHASDIDLLVAPAHVAPLAGLLKAEGYRRLLPAEALGQRAFEAWSAACKESIWANRAGIVLELHHALVDNPRLLPGVSLDSPVQEVEIGGGARLPTLAKDDLFAYLCAHGAIHAWSRLKWLADVAGLIRDDPPVEIERLHERSLALGAGRCTGSALLLCAELFGTQLPPHLAERLRCDGATLSLARTALATMAKRGGAVELDEMLLGTVAQHLSHFLLVPGWAFKAAEFRRRLSRPHDRAEVPLPRALGFLYPLITLPRWLSARARLAGR